MMVMRHINLAEQREIDVKGQTRASLAIPSVWRAVGALRSSVPRGYDR
jgi:hypothetical protein